MKTAPFLLSLTIITFAGAAHLSYAANAPASAKPAAATIATTDGEAAGTRIDVQQLKRVSGDALMLKFTVHNDSDTQLGSNTFYENKGNTDDGVYLVDLAGKKKYSVVVDASGNCLCSRGLDAIAAHSSAILWAKFPAPPGDVTKIGVVVPHFIPMDDVPISH